MVLGVFYHNISTDSIKSPRLSEDFKIAQKMTLGQKYSTLYKNIDFETQEIIDNLYEGTNDPTISSIKEERRGRTPERNLVKKKRGP